MAQRHINCCLSVNTRNQRRLENRFDSVIEPSRNKRYINFLNHVKYIAYTRCSLILRLIKWLLVLGVRLLSLKIGIFCAIFNQKEPSMKSQHVSIYYVQRKSDLTDELEDISVFERDTISLDHHIVSSSNGWEQKKRRKEEGYLFRKSEDGSWKGNLSILLQCVLQKYRIDKSEESAELVQLNSFIIPPQAVDPKTPLFISKI